MADKKTEVGRIETITHQFTAEDVAQFAELTGDTNPVHLDDEFAGTTIFGKRVVHGMYTAALFSRIFGTVWPGAGSIYLEQHVSFLRPVFLGDTIKATVELTDYDIEKSVGTFATTATNEMGKVVISGAAKLKYA